MFAEAGYDAIEAAAIQAVQPMIREQEHAEMVPARRRIIDFESGSMGPQIGLNRRHNGFRASCENQQYDSEIRLNRYSAGLGPSDFPGILQAIAANRHFLEM